MRKKVSSTACLGSKFRISGKLGDFSAEVDQPVNSGGDGSAPSPLDYMLFSIAACQATLARIIAMQNKIDLRDYTVTVEGELDTDVLLGKSTEMRCGFASIRTLVTIDADLNAEEKLRFAQEVEHRCPVSENIRNSTPTTLEIIE